MSSPKEKKSPTAEELFDQLIIDDTKRPDGAKPSQGPPRPGGGRPSMSGRPSGGPSRGENMPPRGRGGPPPNSHRPTRSQEEALRARRMQAGSKGERPMPGSPNRRPERRARRNSESSIMDKPMSSEEKKAREQRHRERERRHREGGKDGKRPGRRIDVIDQLDATSIYGTGLFHHDGPFDACNPHRNRKGSRRAPMQAFAKDSANNSLGGSGPVNARPDHKLFMGQEPHEATSMYASGAREKDGVTKTDVAFFDPKQGEDYEYGEVTDGLGGTTFFEGTPATRTAIANDQRETAQAAMEGLGRKKSVVQRFRSIKRPVRDYGEGRMNSPEYYSPRDMPTGGSASERNPFFSEFDKSGGEDRITVKNKDSGAGSPTSPSGPATAPPASLERRLTSDATLDGAEMPAKGPSGGGFLSRVKSLKGGRRAAPRPPTKEVPVPVPGSAM
ncbi:Pal1-domain-containing protein [Xylariomycetidae sp. FL0641]|nr:Pal1-domain-containing protein [Xylariomycetidae sp. FL0641]